MGQKRCGAGAAPLLCTSLVLLCTQCSLQQSISCSQTAGSGVTRQLSSLSPQELADGALVSSVLATWDFQGRAGVLTATPGKAVTLSCVTAANATVAQPGGPPGILQPTAIDLAGAAGLVMRGVSLTTDCATVLSYQQYFCTTYRVAGSLQLERGAVHFNSWQDGFTSLDNVTLTCPSPEAAAQPPCRLAAVQTAQQLLEAFTEYAAAAASGSANVTIVIANNISIPASARPTRPVAVSTNVLLVGSMLLHRPVLDFQLMTGLWELLPNVTVILLNLTCVNLAPDYFSPGYIFSQFGMLSERVWAFRRYQRQLAMTDTTLVVPTEQLNYTRYWLTYLVSPVPEAQAKAAWMNMFQVKVLAVNSTGVYYSSMVTLTANYTNVRVTDSLAGYPMLPQVTGLKDLLSESVPLTSVNPVVNTSDLLLALLPNNSVPDDQGRRWVLLLANVSLSDVVAGGSADGVVVLPGSMILGRAAGVPVVRMGLGMLPNTLAVPNGTTVVFRQLILSGLAGSSPSYAPADPLAVLSSPLWGVGLATGGGAKARLENCSVLLSADELRLLQAALLRPGQAASLPAPSRPLDARLLAEVAAFFTYSAADPPAVSSYGPLYLAVDTGTTRRYAMYGVTFRTAVAADGEVAAAGFSALGVPSGGGGTGRRGLAGWAVGVIVGCVVGGSVLLLLALAAVLLARRRRLRSASTDERDSYAAKYLAGSADGVEDRPPAGPAGASACGFYSVTPSQELTNSSQVLRPGARASDMERAAAAAGMSKMSSSDNTHNTSAGLGATGRSGSTTGGISTEISSSAVGAAAAGGGSSAPLRGGHRTLLPLAAGGDAAAAATAPQGAEQPPAAPPPHGQHSSSMATDSFERPPTASNLGQHGASGRAGAGHRLASMLGGAASSSHAGGVSLTPSSPASGGGAIMKTQSAMSTGGGGGAIDQMHAMIQVLGREFNDRQLEIHGMLGKGAHGTVYKGRWRGLPVAVKSMIFSNESSARQQQRPLMEAAISSNLMHPNIVTTYSYELREVEHEMASLSPELARQGGGWRLLIIQEYCDAGPLRRIIDCGFFLTPQPQSSRHQRTRLRLPTMGLLRKDSPSGGAASEGSTGPAPRGGGGGEAGAASGAVGTSRCSSGSSEAGSASGNGNGNGKGHGGSSRGSPGSEVAAAAGPGSTARVGGNGSGNGGGNGGAAQGPAGAQAGAAGQPLKPALDEVPADVPPRPGSSREAALRYVEAALMIARGLQHIHDKNIVHGDLNPNNVLLMRSPGSHLGLCLKVADFGLSIRMAEGESHMSNLFQGSPYYCAPEVVLSGKVGKSADIYSLGIMLWELQNGSRPPWRMGVRLRTFPSLNTAELEFGPDTPPRYARLARDCFHGSKDARPHIGSVVEQLAALQAELVAAPGQRGA